LSSAFLVLLGVTSTGVSVFAAGYFRHGEGTLPGLLCLQYHVFLASMGFVLLADDAYAFMVAWETMALSSYFLVTTQHRIPEIRRAGFLYLLMAHLGAIAILLSFGVMQGGSWQFTFDAMRMARLDPTWATVAFMLALVGFGVKAGIAPLHVWLPEAHPAAPSPVSALMSGVMLKTAVYGVLRVTFDLLGHPQWWWGLVVLAFGLFSAFYGVIFAAIQTDMKRLLAWSSIENIGLIYTGIGITIVFHALAMSSFAALALVATLYHCLNHALIKSLLFLGTGAVLHATGERNLGRLGGLIHRMPWVAWLTLVGALAIAGLPPLNGFVSEWLLLQAFLFVDSVPRAFVNMILPIGAAVVALCVALSGYVMVKFFGVIFLGQPREPSLAQARDAGLLCPRPYARRRHPPYRAGNPVTARRRPRYGQRQLVATRTAGSAPGFVQSADLRRCRWCSSCHFFPVGPSVLSRASKARSTLGLRICTSRCAYAGYGRGIRSAHSSCVSTLFPDEA
jgi:formate hydrogenlyase subunit 3/multisubunit Na+/H+ antiporter MnhD subunit